MSLTVNAQNFDQEVLKAELPVIVDVYASWCGPCRAMIPFFEELSVELADKYKFVKLNIDEERDIAIQYSISSIPTFLFIKNGQIVGKETGSMSKETLKNKLESYFG